MCPECTPAKSGAWRRGVDDSVYLTNLAMLILLDPREREFQESNLRKFLAQARYPDAVTLAAFVPLACQQSPSGVHQTQ
jgi:Fe-S cluster biosynthesis and repair protein YggX